MSTGDKKRAGKRTKRSFEQCLGTAATSAAAIYALPSMVSAAIIHVSGAPVSLSATAPAGQGPFDLSVNWDVDGDNNDDFTLRKTGIVATEGPTLRSAYGNMFLNSAGLNGNGVVQASGTMVDSRAIVALPLGAAVGPTLDSGYQFGAPGQTNRAMLSFDSSTSGGYMQHEVNLLTLATTGGFTPDQLQYFGFSFMGSTFYGWAAILHDTQGPDRGMYIVEWAYNDTPNAPIAAGAVPVPAHGLAMLAAGAGSVLAMRRRRREAANGNANT